MGAYKMKLRKDNQIIEIEQDTFPMDPREWDNLGVMVCFHGRYLLGDQDHGLKSRDFNGWDQLEAYLYDELNAAVVLPLYLYDHSGITMRTTDFSEYGYYGHWDSGQVGFIYATKLDYGWSPEFKAEHYPDMSDEQIITKLLRGEVETYDQYLRGDIYQATLYHVETCDLGHEHLDIVDSCGGFYGVDLNQIGETLGIPDLAEWVEE